MDLDLVSLSESLTFRTDLDSHANMVVTGRNVHFVSGTSLTAEVSPFIPDYESMHQVPKADAAIRRDGE